VADHVRVLVCDDVADIRSLLREALQSEPGLEVVDAACDGPTCLDAVRRSHPDVLVLDLAMPGLDGLEVLRRLRDEAPEVAVVVFSGFDRSRMEEIALRLGARAYVQKGAPLGDVAAAVRRAGGAP
jgi:two-component system invasion response regulator UvrY